jgi:hypothetical protein
MAGSLCEPAIGALDYRLSQPGQYSADATLVSRTVPALRMVTFFIDFTSIPHVLIGFSSS